MSELIISNMDDRRPIESFITDKLRTNRGLNKNRAKMSSFEYEKEQKYR